MHDPASLHLHISPSHPTDLCRFQSCSSGMGAHGEVRSSFQKWSCEASGANASLPAYSHEGRNGPDRSVMGPSRRMSLPAANIYSFMPRSAPELQLASRDLFQSLMIPSSFFLHHGRSWLGLCNDFW